MAAFFFIGVVLAAVAVRATWIHVVAYGAQPEVVADIEAPWPQFEIVDRDGRALALSVECFDLTVSPRALWRSHTPRRIAAGVADILGDVEPGEFLGELMPREFEETSAPGWLEPHEPRLLALGPDEAERARLWIATGKAREDEARADRRVHGFELVTLRGRPGWHTLAWEPATALGQAQRIAHLGESAKDRPERWTRRMLDGLLEVIGGEDAAIERLPERVREDLRRELAAERRAALRDALWSELMPSRFRVVRRKVDAGRAQELAQLFSREAVSSFQAQLSPSLDRRHPTRPGGLPVAPGADESSERADDAFSLLGHWGLMDEKNAMLYARRDRERRPYLLPWEERGDPLARYAHDLATHRRAWSGLERLARTELEDGPWSQILDEQTRRYTRRVRSLAPDRRLTWRDQDGLPDYFDHAVDASEVPRVRSTIDAALQVQLNTELGLALDEHRAALAMGIAVDVESGDVLAVDHRSRYAYSGFAPLRHVFTPGSTMKAVIMAIALDRGYVRPTDEFETYAGRRFYVKGRKKHIGEAEGSPQEPKLSAALALAHSCNVILVQIGLRVPARTLRSALVDLGYGSCPNVGMGKEWPGILVPLEERFEDGWSYAYTHASVSFGHEIGVTLWQHAEALATIARGGRRVPLRLLSSIEQGDHVWDLPADRGRRVLGEEACAQVLDMMNLGATLGTGDKVAHPDMHPDIAWIGTKTGTTEKVPTETCLHAELDAYARAAESGRYTLTAAEAAALDGARLHYGGRQTCYTSSMCAIGEGPDGRKVLVLIVVEEPTGRVRFGAQVAGATAVAVLRHALGLPREFGEAVAEAPDFLEATFSSEDAPWASGASRGAAADRPQRDAEDAAWERSR